MAAPIRLAYSVWRNQRHSTIKREEQEEAAQDRAQSIPSPRPVCDPNSTVTRGSPSCPMQLAQCAVIGVWQSMKQRRGRGQEDLLGCGGGGGDRCFCCHGGSGGWSGEGGCAIGWRAFGIGVLFTLLLRC